MKKLKLNKSAFAGGEVLTRLQLKKVMGGGDDDLDGLGSGPGSGPGGYYKCCNYQDCTSCGASTWVPSVAHATCTGNAWKCRT